MFEDVYPEIEGGRFPIKRTVGERVTVRATIFADGHDKIAAAVRYRHVGEDDSPAGDSSGEWSEAPMTLLGNDRWEAEFRVAEQGTYEYTLEAWVDRLATWEHEVEKKRGAGLDVSSEMIEGRVLRTRPPREGAATYEKTLSVWVERERARFGAWYEMFPRSCGTFEEAAARLPAIAAMGFDVLYLPPIHPIGVAFRKGPNNSLNPGPDDPGSPWAIGSSLGGHTAVEPGLGTIEDFERFVEAARSNGLEIALDIAFQTSPDHPYVREHPEWFRHRPDGTVKYAENPPKKYQDIYPLDFESSAWESLWHELLSVLTFWIDRGVRIFRVDNPHTKPLRFWEWLIREVREQNMDAIFLSEAFTRPAVMKHLAKLGFTQSYTYFTWRNSKAEIVEYFTELTQTEVREYFRPNLFANTPDILHAYLQSGGRPAFEVRLVLAATLGASYGLYSGFELCENRAAAPGSEEYLDSEKYQIVHRDWDRPGHIKDLVTQVNRIRREQPALQYLWPLAFHETDNDQLLFYSKSRLMVVVNLDTVHPQHGWIKVPLADWRLPLDLDYRVRDLLSGETYHWRGEWNYVRLDPRERVAHILTIDV